ncbi:MAG: signal peptidase II [Phycisphaeraceae bacterium]
MPESSTNSVAKRAGRSPRAILSYLIIMSLALVCDLWGKSYAFDHVANAPLSLSRDPDVGGTVVQYPDSNGNIITTRDVPPHEGITVVPKVLALKLVINPGAVFGIGKGAQWFFIVVSLCATVFIGIVFYRSKPDAKLLHVCLALILAGALGNLYDRVLYNGVRDMLQLFPGVHLPFGLEWPGGANEIYPWIFNIADVALVIGVVLLMIVTWKSEKKPQPADLSAPG